MRSWLILSLLLGVALLSGCTRADGIGVHVAKEDAVRMAMADTPMVAVSYSEQYATLPPVHVIYGDDGDGRRLIAWVYTTVIRYEYADKLMNFDQAVSHAQAAGFPVEAIETGSLGVFQGRLEGRDRPIFWRLGTHAGFIWIEAETGDVLRRLDAK